MTITDFLLARIAEDEAAWSGGVDLATRPDFAKLSRHVLAECEAKRRIVHWCGPREPVVPGATDSSSTTASFVLRALASVYADHPDYDEEWRP